MKTSSFVLIVCSFIISTTAYAQKDVCCILSKTSGNQVTTFADYTSDAECKGGTNTTTYMVDKKICAPLPADSTDCSDRGQDAQQKRCKLCGFVWTEEGCVVQDLAKEVEKLKEEKKKLEEQKKTKAATPTTTAPEITVDKN
ncbi:MAG: hypothetical protein KDD46_03875 [Bdellovibrionales bacterium]|nr:hypothetical protein [Bdellovibrionales bacterium]